MSTEPGRQSIIVVALDATETGDYAIELARTLAPTDAPELLGLFVESTQLLAHARSSWAREISLTGSERALDRRVLERQLRSQAARARARFEAATARLGLRHRFEIARGDALFESIKRAATAEALVVSLARSHADSASLTAFFRQLAAARPPLVLLAREGWHSGRGVAVLVNEASAAEGVVLEAAARVARRSGSPMTLIVQASGDVEAGELNRRLVDMLGSHGIEAGNVMILSGTDVGGIVQAARACRAGLLALRAPSQAAGSAAIGELVRRFPGALMLVRA